MTYVDVVNYPREPLSAGRAYDRINRFFGLLGQVGGADQLDDGEASSTSHMDPREELLRMVQDEIFGVSMHLPKGFAVGLSRQFANLMDADAWEDNDELISPDALNAFVQTILSTKTKRRPGIGTNGRGSITCSWTSGENRLTVECMPNGRLTLVLCRRREEGDVERAAFEAVRPDRVLALLSPFDPEVWFDG